MNVLLNVDQWAIDQFSNCELGDKRRTKRLVKMAGQLASKIGQSFSSCCAGNEADLEGGYRLLRNEDVSAEAIARGAYEATKRQASSSNIILAIEDTTTLSYMHSVKDELGDLGGPESSTSKGFHVHSILLADAQSEQTIGLIEQCRWLRKEKSRGKRHDRYERLYEEKESYKWEQSSRNMEKRLGELMPKVISICDREADIYEYLSFKQSGNQRFIVRASQNRSLDDEDMHSISEAINEAPRLGEYVIDIQQKSGRKARQATISVKSCRVTLKSPHRKDGILEPMGINVLVATEEKAGKDVTPFTWILLTSEQIETFDDARTVIHYYELRWRIEDFHKAWKSGAGVERQRMQTASNLERMIVLLGFVSVRLLQLKEALEREKNCPTAKKIECTNLLSDDEWKVLWLSQQRNKKKKRPIPKRIPSLGWAYETIAKLGGWNDSKRTGKACWSTIWEGWFRLQDRLAGYVLAKIDA